MPKTDANCIPLLFAGDINLYSMARAFHEQYGIKPHAIGKYPSGPCFRSNIIHYTANVSIDREDTFMAAVVRFAEEHQDKQVLLIGCGDSYVQLISQNLDRMPKNVVAPYIGIDLMNRLIHKEHFYELCRQTGLDYPDTFVHRPGMGKQFELPFEGPYILKPSNGIEYWRHPFANQKKVFKMESRGELEAVIKSIYEAGYNDSLIIQNFIPGDDTFMRVMTCYSDQMGRVRLMCLGHVLLEEHTPHGIGNHAVIMTERQPELEEKLRRLLDDLGYVGFSNFDIKFDQRDGRFKIFEINTRQGRSNYYVTGAGANLAQYVVEDWINKHPIDFRVIDAESLWMVVPKGVAFKYIRQPEYRAKMRQLIRHGKLVNPLFYRHDCGLQRSIRLLRSQYGHYVKYKTYLGK
ncbi:MAG TPA: ATP-grasp domain-containing protein [Clostridiales bacterium]|jgi:D-aspartate ligase|nr:ATP-grasp domain-containing protein [Clostridiales bacterium]